MGVESSSTLNCCTCKIRSDVFYVPHHILSKYVKREMIYVQHEVLSQIKVKFCLPSLNMLSFATLIMIQKSVCLLLRSFSSDLRRTSVGSVCVDGVCKAEIDI